MPSGYRPTLTVTLSVTVSAVYSSTVAMVLSIAERLTMSRVASASDCLALVFEGLGATA